MTQKITSLYANDKALEDAIEALVAADAKLKAELMEDTDGAVVLPTVLAIVSLVIDLGLGVWMFIGKKA